VRHSAWKDQGSNSHSIPLQGATSTVAPPMGGSFPLSSKRVNLTAFGNDPLIKEMNHIFLSPPIDFEGLIY